MATIQNNHPGFDLPAPKLDCHGAVTCDTKSKPAIQWGQLAHLTSSWIPTMVFSTGIRGIPANMDNIYSEFKVTIPFHIKDVYLSWLTDIQSSGCLSYLCFLLTYILVQTLRCFSYKFKTQGVPEILNFYCLSSLVEFIRDKMKKANSVKPRSRDTSYQDYITGWFHLLKTRVYAIEFDVPGPEIGKYIKTNI